jgi:hypothetical protein
MTYLTQSDSAVYIEGAWLSWHRLSEEGQPNRSDYLFACSPERLTKDALKAMTDTELVPHLRRAADYRHSWGDHEYGRILSEAAKPLESGQ